MSLRDAVTMVLLSVVWFSPAWGLDSHELLIETQRIERAPNTLRMIWWIPTEYWEETLKNAPNCPPGVRTTFIQAVDKYVVVAVIDGQFNPFGSLVPIGRDDIVSAIHMMADGSEGRRPLLDGEVSADTTTLLKMMKVQFEATLGQVGKALEFVLFDGRDEQQQPIINSRRSGHLGITYRDKRYFWRLPLSSLLPKRIDPRTGEEFPGNYEYNPFTGSRLTTNEAKSGAPADTDKGPH